MGFVDGIDIISGVKKVFILDTNVLLNDPQAVFKFSDNDVVIPIAVIEQIDLFKREQSVIAGSARKVSRILDRMARRGRLSDGIPIFPEDQHSGCLFVNIGKQVELPQPLSSGVGNEVLAVALSLQKRTESPVVVVSNDSNLRIKANAFGLPAEEYVAGKIEAMFSGIRHLTVEPSTVSTFYQQHYLNLPDVTLNANEFVLFEDHGKQVASGIYRHGQIEMIEPRQTGVWGIYPRNSEQSFGLTALLDDNIKLVTLSGRAGTGKTLLAIAAGLAKTTDEDIYQKLLVARPIFPLGRDLGFLPGDLDEKLNPWMQPIYDNLEFLMSGGKTHRHKRLSYLELIEQGLLAIEPITYIRGRSIPKQFFIVDEAQNLSPHEIKTIITRAGEGTKIVLTGDPYQIDNPYLDVDNNGLTFVIERFKTVEVAAHVTLTKGERSELATLAAELL